MAKKRTRAQKQHARHVYHLPAVAEVTLEAKAVPRLRTAPAYESSLTLDVQSFRRDLLKTFFLCILIITLEISLWWLWR